jgi:hypothetical protein
MRLSLRASLAVLRDLRYQRGAICLLNVDFSRASPMNGRRPIGSRSRGNGRDPQFSAVDSATTREAPLLPRR